MVMTRARHRKELKCDILKVKRHLGELSDRDFNKMVESPTQALVDDSPEAPEASDSGNDEWRPHSEITKRRPTRKRKTQPKKEVTKKPKPAERNPTRQAKKSRKQATKTSKIRCIEFQENCIVCHYCKPSIIVYEDEAKRKLSLVPDNAAHIINSHIAEKHPRLSKKIASPKFTCWTCKKDFEDAENGAAHNKLHRKTSLGEIKAKYNLTEEDLDCYPKLFCESDFLYRISNEGDELAEGVLQKIDNLLIPNNSRRVSPKWPEYKIFNDSRWYSKKVLQEAFYLPEKFDPGVVNIEVSEEKTESGDVEVYYHQADFQLFVQDFLFPPTQVVLTFDEEYKAITIEAKQFLADVKHEVVDDDYDVSNAQSGVIFDSASETDSDCDHFEKLTASTSMMPNSSAEIDVACSDSSLSSDDLQQELLEIEQMDSNVIAHCSGAQTPPEPQSSGSEDDLIYVDTKLPDHDGQHQKNNNLEYQPVKYRPSRLRRGRSKQSLT